MLNPFMLSVLSCCRSSPKHYTHQASQQYAAPPGFEGPLWIMIQLHQLLLHVLPQRQLLVLWQLWLLVRLTAQITPQRPAELPLNP